ncbi:hypothetical protein BLS_004634 [Venturia inaequalis]|uniref:Uncharacterized protein n=1 Tax=Venturia inaequalis TaxID=5025 RepID=A0A8H3YV59_VENIN|nr:hypothetical protein BLS_004634 [Venturia inaequalis]
MSPSHQNKRNKNNDTENNTATTNDSQKDSAKNQSTKTKTSDELHEERIESILIACQRIWGSYTDFDLGCKWVEQDGVQGWSVQIRKAYGDRVGVQEMWTLVKETEEEAWTNMGELLNEKVA